MKSLLTLCLCLLSLVSFGQEIPKRANTIIVESSDSAATIFKNLKVMLLERQYTLTASDSDVFSITAKGTVSPGVSKSNEVILNLFVKQGSPNQVVLRGEFDTRSSYGIYKIEYSPLSGKNYKEAWNRMDELAKSYPSGKVSYLKK